MWDSGFMADIDNLNEMNENFDTIKTLLNSIRAQGILNTSDVDKLLSGINAKLEKINTEEDIDLIKIFLTELKQSLEERHSVLLSKFGAIESLFSNLLKNSNQLPKASEFKEWYDIVATNLSVFSREVVAQKESLTDITLRLDAIRSDDSQKKDIIKNITLLKPDLERLNNGFDSIVISLNDNFKTLAKTLSSIDKTEYLDRFADNFHGLEMSSNALLSAIQLLDKKTETVENSLKDIATKSDFEQTSKNIDEIRLLNRSLNENIEEIGDKYAKIDVLADKIDASVSIIAGLKTGLEDIESQNTQAVIDNLGRLEAKLKEIKDDTAFDEFKTSLSTVLDNIIETTSNLKENISLTSDSISSILENIRSLNLNTHFDSVLASIDSKESGIKAYIDSSAEKYANLSESNLNKIINNITLSADSLNTRLSQSQTELSAICESSFGTVFENIAELKRIVSQIDENDVSANNAMFSNISDRLNLFETALKESLETQEFTTAEASAKLCEQVENIKNLSSVLDYKMDSSVVEISNMTRMFETLRGSVDSILALNFVDTVKDLRADIYASKQDLNTIIDSASNELSENITKDLYGKYELLISKLDSVEDEFKKTQASALSYVKETMEKISDSLVDVISYVSESKEFPTEELDKKIDGIANTLKETNLNYVENVRDIVDIIRVQVENNLKDLESDNAKQYARINEIVTLSTENLRKDIRNSYDKLVEVRNTYEDLRELINVNNLDNAGRFEKLVNAANDINAEFDSKLSALRNALLERVTEFKNEFTCESADKVNEFRFMIENLNNKNLQELNASLESVKTQLESNNSENTASRNTALEALLGDLTELKSLIKNSFSENTESRVLALDNLIETINGVKSSVQEISLLSGDERKNALNTILANFENIKNKIEEKSALNIESREKSMDMLLANFENIKSQIEVLSSSSSSSRETVVNNLNDSLKELKNSINDLTNSNNESRSIALESLTARLDEVKTLISDISSKSSSSKEDILNNFEENYTSLKTVIANTLLEESSARKEAFNKISSDLISLDNSMRDMYDGITEGRKLGLNEIFEHINSLKEQITAYAGENVNSDNYVISRVNECYEILKSKIDTISDESRNTRNNALTQILDSFDGLRDLAQTLNNKTIDDISSKTNLIIDCFETVKLTLSKIDDNIDSDLTRQFSIIESNFESLISQMTILNDKSEQTLVDKINDEYRNISEKIDENLTQKLEDYKTKIEETFDVLTEKAQTQSSYLQERISDINSVMKTVWADQAESNIRQIDEISDRLKNILDENIKIAEIDYNALKDRLDDFTKELESNNEILTQNLKAQLDDMTKYVDSVLDIQVQETGARADEINNMLESISEKITSKFDTINAISGEHLDAENAIRAEIASLTGSVEDSNDLLKGFISDTNDRLQQIMNTTAETSVNEVKTIESSTDKLLEQIELGKQSVVEIRDFISNVIQQKLNAVSEDIEKETDAVIRELIDHFDFVKKSQQDIVIQVTTGIETVVANQIYNNIEDLKSYLDVKTDSSVISEKLDNLKIDITSILDNTISDLNKMLSVDVFKGEISDFRVANEILVNSAADRVNEKIGTFIGEFSAKITEMISGGNQSVEDKLALFDKKFVDTVVDKYEEIKLVSNKHNALFEEVKASIDNVLSDFHDTKNEIENKINNLIETIKQTSDSTNSEIRQLNDCFEHLRSQISNKSFDEAFQASINKQITSLESLIKEQMSYIQDINDICASNLPDVAELDTMVKYTIVDKLNQLSEKLENLDSHEKINKGFESVNNLLVATADNLSEQLEAQNVEEIIGTALKETKSDIITQFLNIFNQISFVTEQEEILDFIQEKHDELIKILSHIITKSDDRIDSVRKEISLINDKITSIISSEGDVDYIYSLQDLESDIANLRIVLKEMKDNTDNYSGDFDKLMESTEGVYKLVESIKEDLPDKKSFDSLTEDIVSISTRTNKLILASDESYKTLKDNLHDFKLVINDLDERTRNFAQESGMDKINSKLNAINTMIQNGAKNNQVFNEVFEYLAEWVDNAGNQINEISNKVDTLDDIGQIKVMLQDMKAESEDNSDNVELIEALGNVFDKQAKKISALEAKLDKIIVETTINSKNDKFDMKPMEETLNRFLAAIGDKITTQQEKIDSLESKMKKMVDMLDEKDTAQLTKKVGGMDRQIAKLNKSIEKIASHVVEK